MENRKSDQVSFLLQHKFLNNVYQSSSLLFNMREKMGTGYDLPISLSHMELRSFCHGYP